MRAAVSAQYQIRRHRLAASQSLVAEEAGVSRDTVAVVETGGGSARSRAAIDAALTRMEGAKDPGDTRTREQRHRDKALDQAAERAHAALLVTAGTAGALSRERVRESIQFAMENHREYLGESYFHLSGGMVLHIKRDDRPWPTFTVLVPATPGLFWMEED